MGMDFDARRRGSVVTAPRLVACSAISGIFLGVVAILCVYPSGDRHALVVGGFVACGAFAANALVVICVTAVVAEGRVQRRAGRALQDWLELARGSRSRLTGAESVIRRRVPEDRGARSSVPLSASEPGSMLDAEELTNSMPRS
jgi:hypothetical protein